MPRALAVVPPVPWRGFYLVPTFSLPPAPGRLERLGRVMAERRRCCRLPERSPGVPGCGCLGAPASAARVGPLCRTGSFEKVVHVRASHDGWASFCDHPARYVPRSPPGAGVEDQEQGDPILIWGLGLGPGQVSASSPDDGGRTGPLCLPAALC